MILDGLAGLLGGAAGGMQQIQQQRQRDIEMQLRQRQVEAQLDQQRREAVEAARKYLNPGSKVDPQQLSEFAKYGLHGGIVKGPDGMGIVEDTPQSLLQRQALKNAELETEDLTTRVAQSKIALATQQDILKDPGGFFQRPIGERMVRGQVGGLKNVTLPEEDARIRIAEIQAQGRAQAAAMAAGASRYRTDATEDNSQSLNLQRALTQAQQELDRLYPKDPWGRPGKVPPGVTEQVVQKYMTMFGVSPQAPIPGSAPGVPTQGGRPVLGGKYTVEEIQ